MLDSGDGWLDLPILKHHSWGFLFIHSFIFILVEEFEIGRGTSSVVFLGEYIPTREKVAIKKILKLSRSTYMKVKNEIELMKSCEHTYVLKVVDEDEDENHYRIILKLCPFGSLKSVINQFKNKGAYFSEAV
jgi:serine/threonine protein kinase